MLVPGEPDMDTGSLNPYKVQMEPMAESSPGWMRMRMRCFGYVCVHPRHFRPFRFVQSGLAFALFVFVPCLDMDVALWLGA